MSKNEQTSKPLLDEALKWESKDWSLPYADVPFKCDSCGKELSEYESLRLDVGQLVEVCYKCFPKIQCTQKELKDMEELAKRNEDLPNKIKRLLDEEVIK